MLLQATCPAKLNLTLSIVGRRADGFHALVSLVVPVALADMLVLEDNVDGADDTLTVESAEAGETVPAGPDNLVLKAVSAFREATGSALGTGIQFSLTKRIPAGSGLGGGSSDAATALELLNQRAGSPLDAAALSALAAKIGSDCPLFLRRGAVIMRGRGEILEAVRPAWVERMRGRAVLLFRPDFGIQTAWAYRTLAEGAQGQYTSSADAEAALADCIGKLDAPGYEPSNDLAPIAFGKYLALPSLLQTLRQDLGLVAQMTGSGSACFALAPEGGGFDEAMALIRECWGPRAWVESSVLKP
ncbi:MAG: 4-(cytidine 5'-diphospho)-2-C-methyl-D-erythritol kinase [Opitutales bacterium]